MDHPDPKVAEVADQVCERHAALTIRTPKGNEVRVVPVPKPIGHRKGVPIYRVEDIQFLYPDHPYWFDRDV